jgi:nitrite reductase/ring-hydroxylating ferredoxin subunit
MGWIRVADTDSLSNGDLIGFDYNDKKIMVAKAQGKIYATYAICTHEYADLSTGFFNEDEKTVSVHCIYLFSNWMTGDHKIHLLKCL